MSIFVMSTIWAYVNFQFYPILDNSEPTIVTYIFVGDSIHPCLYLFAKNRLQFCTDQDETLQSCFQFLSDLHEIWYEVSYNYFTFIPEVCQAHTAFISNLHGVS